MGFFVWFGNLPIIFVSCGNPYTQRGLESFLSFLPKEKHIHWTIGCYGGNLVELAPFVARSGGHLAVGIGDYPYKELGKTKNEEVVRLAAEIAIKHGREIASPQETREMLGMH